MDEDGDAWDYENVLEGAPITHDVVVSSFSFICHWTVFLRAIGRVY